MLNFGSYYCYGRRVTFYVKKVVFPPINSWTSPKTFLWKNLFSTIRESLTFPGSIPIYYEPNLIPHKLFVVHIQNDWNYRKKLLKAAGEAISSQNKLIIN